MRSVLFSVNIAQYTEPQRIFKNSWRIFLKAIGFWLKVCLTCMEFMLLEVAILTLLGLFQTMYMAVIRLPLDLNYLF